MQIRLYPNGELRARVSPPPVQSSGLGDVPSPLLVNGDKLAISSLPPVEACDYPSCSWPRVGYGGLPVGTSFSAYARKMLARAGGVFSSPEDGRVVFLTGTLPGGTVSAMEALARYSSWVVHQLVTVIPRCAGILPSECQFMWVWELQERGALHWHGVFQFPDRDRAEIVIARFKDIWCGLIDSISAKTGIDMAERWDGGTHAGNYEVWRVDAQFAEKSPSRYLAKYLSKDASKVVGENFFFPTRWYGCSRSILLEMRAKTLYLSTGSPCVVGDERLSSFDLNLLDSWVKESSFSSWYKDKYGEGWTFVFYFEEEKMAGIKEQFPVPGNKLPPNSKKKDKWKPNPGVPSPYVVWKSIDEVLAWPMLAERLYNDIGTYYRTQLDLYRRGSSSVWGDVYWIDRHAEYLLYLQGLRSGVNSGSAPVGGLTPDASKKLGQEWGAEQLSLLSKLPF